MAFFPDEYTFAKDVLWTVSIIIGLVVNIGNIRRNKEIARKKRLMEKASKKGFEPITDKEKKLPEGYKASIQAINNGEVPEIYYDNGYFNVGWNWYIGNSVIILIEKKFFKDYTFRVWKEVNGEWLWSERKKMSDLGKDEELKNRILSIKDKEK